uniref:Uncharacterized protein n=1 Tax=Roseihalotalea indica TaxID=2867963 RepID=A0AA49GIS3_9BACT|nr:hypothetical protein K4G66_18810 [Tunicatimonas sp. TK19036]
MTKPLLMTTLLLVCFFSIQCSEEDIQARLPASCETNDCPDTHPTPSPKPSSNDVAAWLNTYALQQKQSPTCAPFLGLVRRQSSGWLYSCNTVHAVLKGEVMVGRIRYYRLDLYFYLRPTESCGQPMSTPRYAGSMYLSRSTRKPGYASGFYGGSRAFRWILDPHGRAISGWQAYYYYRDQKTAQEVGFFDGVIATKGGCWEM